MFKSAIIPYADADTAPYRLYVVGDWSGREIGRFLAQSDTEAKSAAYRWTVRQYNAALARGIFGGSPQRKHIWTAYLVDQSDTGITPEEYRATMS